MYPAMRHLPTSARSQMTSGNADTPNHSSRQRDRRMTRPIAITMGDPCGIGPEICVKLFAEGLPAPALVVGDAGLLGRTAKTLGLDIRVREIEDAAEAAGAPGELPVLGVGALPSDLPIGRVDARAGRA